MKRNRTLISLLLAGFVSLSIGKFAQANCQDPVLRQKVTQTAKEEGVNERELLSIIAHESRCHYFTVAWNKPGHPETAKSKFLETLEEGKALAEDLITSRLYRVDVGIGQINNEAHIRPKGWTLDEILSPETALNRVAAILKERGWANYHSSNQVLAKKWQSLALAALDQALLKPKGKNLPVAIPAKKPNPLVVFYASNPNRVERSQKTDWIIYGDL